MKPIAKLYHSKKNSSKKRGIDFDLTLDEFKKLREITTCFYTGEELIFSQTPQPNSWSLDRVDNILGYTYSNVVVCSHRANLEKSTSFDEARKRILDPVLYQQIAEKLKVQPSVITKKESKISRIWKILTE
jgi:hypothetical protein